MRVLSSKEVAEFCERWKACPGIVLGFITEHARRGGRTGVDLSDLNDLFRRYF